MRTVDQRTRAISLNPAKDGCASNIQLPALLHNRLVQRLVLPLVILPEMNAQHFGLSLELHARTSWRRSVSS